MWDQLPLLSQVKKRPLSPSFSLLKAQKNGEDEGVPLCRKGLHLFIHSIRTCIPELSTATHLHKVQDIIVSQAPLPLRAIERKTSPHVQGVT